MMTKSGASERIQRVGNNALLQIQLNRLIGGARAVAMVECSANFSLI